MIFYLPIDTTKGNINHEGRKMSIRTDEEFKSLIPPLSREEYKQLEENILAEGIRDPLVVWETFSGDDILIDGHNRWEISAKHAGIPFEIKKYNFDTREEVKEWIIKNQLGRRNIPPFVRAELALKLKPMIAERAKEKQAEYHGNQHDGLHQKSDKEQINTNKELANAAGVSHDTIHKVEKINEKAPDEVKEALRKGDMSINQAYSMYVAPPKSHAQSMKEFKLQAREEHKEFKESSGESVVSMADLKKDKANLEVIALDVSTTIQKVFSSVSTIGILKKEEVEIMINHLKPDEKRQMISSAHNSIRILTHLIRTISEQ